MVMALMTMQRGPAKHCDQESALPALLVTCHRKFLTAPPHKHQTWHGGRSSPPTWRTPSSSSTKVGSHTPSCPTSSNCPAQLSTMSSVSGRAQVPPSTYRGLVALGSSRGGPRSSCRGQRQSLLWQHAKTSRTLWARQDDMSQCPLSPGHWDVMVSTQGAPGRFPWRPKDTSDSSSSLPRAIWMTLRMTGGRSSGQTRQS